MPTPTPTATPTDAAIGEAIANAVDCWMHDALPSIVAEAEGTLQAEWGTIVELGTEEVLIHLADWVERAKEAQRTRASLQPKEP